MQLVFTMTVKVTFGNRKYKVRFLRSWFQLSALWSGTKVKLHNEIPSFFSSRDWKIHPIWLSVTIETFWCVLKTCGKYGRSVSSYLFSGFKAKRWAILGEAWVAEQHMATFSCLVPDSVYQLFKAKQKNEPRQGQQYVIVWVDIRRDTILNATTVVRRECWRKYPVIYATPRLICGNKSQAS